MRYPVLRAERLLLTLPGLDAAPRVVDYFLRNREHLEKWEPERPAGFYEVGFWQRRLSRNRREYDERRSAHLFLFGLEPDEHRVLGSCNFSHVIGGAFQACHLGYSLSEELQGQGLMYEALGAALRFAFRELVLHRVMACYMPENRRSARLLKRLGFEQEGLAREYLRIDGRWQDHVLTSLIDPGGEQEARR